MARPNKGDEIKITAFGKTLTIQEWNKIYHVPANAVRNRMYRGWKPERAVSEPVQLSPEDRERRRRQTMSRYL